MDSAPNFRSGLLLARQFTGAQWPAATHDRLLRRWAFVQQEREKNPAGARRLRAPTARELAAYADDLLWPLHAQRWRCVPQMMTTYDANKRGFMCTFGGRNAPQLSMSVDVVLATAQLFSSSKDEQAEGTVRTRNTSWPPPWSVGLGLPLFLSRRDRAIGALSAARFSVISLSGGPSSFRPCAQQLGSFRISSSAEGPCVSVPPAPSSSFGGRYVYERRGRIGNGEVVLSTLSKNLQGRTSGR